MRHAGTMQRSIVCVVAIALLSGCTTTREVAAIGQEPLDSKIRVGDSVEVEKRDGTTVKFKVQEVSDEGLRGSSVFIATPDISSIRVIEGAHAALVVFAVVLTALLVWMIVDPKDVCGDWPAKPCEDGEP
jgi:hypothetical protein